MKSRSWFLVLFPWLTMLPSCTPEESSLIKLVQPLNGETRVDLMVTPVLEVSSLANWDASARKVVLYDISGASRQTVAGSIEIADTRLTYHPGAPLPDGHVFELLVEKNAITSDEVIPALDESESPPEEIVWPYRLRFYTQSRPRIRAVYLQEGKYTPQVWIRFSQPMEPQTTAQAIQLTDFTTQKPLLSYPVRWTDSTHAIVELKQTLDPLSLYAIEVSHLAQSEDNLHLDGNDNGILGEDADDFSAKFTGAQVTIFSRLAQ